jgi:bacterioferritin
MDDRVINELNTFLEGEFMAIHGYERFIQNVEEPGVKSEFQKIQQDHKTHAALVAERIQNLGGVPSDGPGIKGMMSEMMNKFKQSSDDTKFIIKDACDGENKGIKMAEEIVKGDLDPESRKLIEDILDKDREHVTLLNNMIH